MTSSTLTYSMINLWNKLPWRLWWYHNCFQVQDRHSQVQWQLDQLIHNRTRGKTFKAPLLALCQSLWPSRPSSSYLQCKITRIKCNKDEEGLHESNSNYQKSLTTAPSHSLYRVIFSYVIILIWVLLYNHLHLCPNFNKPSCLINPHLAFAPP